MAFTVTTENIATDGKLGVDFYVADTSQQHAAGAIALGERGSVFKYGQANGAITGRGYTVLLDPDYAAVALLSVTNSGGAQGELVGVAQCALADDEWGWFQVAGTSPVYVAASAAANTTLNTTATGGVLDDNDLTGSENIDGLVLNAADGGSGGNVVAILNFPVVGAAV